MKKHAGSNELLKNIHFIEGQCREYTQIYIRVCQFYRFYLQFQQTVLLILGIY